MGLTRPRPQNTEDPRKELANNRKYVAHTKTKLYGFLNPRGKIIERPRNGTRTYGIPNPRGKIIERPKRWILRGRQGNLRARNR